MDREIAGDLQSALASDFGLFGLEGYGGIFCHIKEVGAAEVVITALNARVH